MVSTRRQKVDSDEVTNTVSHCGRSIKAHEVETMQQCSPAVNANASCALSTGEAADLPTVREADLPNTGETGVTAECALTEAAKLESSRITTASGLRLVVSNDPESRDACHSPSLPLGNPSQPNESSSKVSAPSSGITDTMVEEERKLAEERLKIDDLERTKMQKEWDDMTSKVKEERFQKLQTLLKKSSLYTSYLVKRMKDQGCRQPLTEDSSAKGGTQAAESHHNGAPVLFTGGSLRRYQKDGLSWLNALYENGVNGILGDEMGLGKTVQCIAAISHLVAMNVGGPYLIVAPLSTVPNWVSEFQKFSPKVPVILYHGTKEERAQMRLKIRKSHNIDGKFKTQPVVVTSYEISMNDRNYLSNFAWKYLIVDEGHRMKNVHCRLTKELRMYNTTHRVLLTGTPLQNNLSELWSLLNFLLPEIFDDLESFESWFQLENIGNDSQDQLIAEEKKRNILATFHQILTPFLLRRLKTDVDLRIPPKKEVVVPANLTDRQKTLYQAAVDKTLLELVGQSKPACGTEALEEDAHGRSIRKAKKRKVDYSTMMQSEDDCDDDEASLNAWLASVAPEKEKCAPIQKKSTEVLTLSLKNILMQLRKICNHPYLISHSIDSKTGLYPVDEKLVSSSGKMQILDRFLSELHKRKHKVLLFSQMTRMLDIIEDYCVLRKYKYCRLDGSTNIDDRREQIGSFNSNEDYFIFLLSTRAGGLGINLSAADTVIIYDSDWNPQSDMQAQDRCHRIGQTRPVVVYRFVCSGTVDEKMVQRAALKKRLEQMVIHKEQFKMGLHTDSFNEAVKPVTTQELLQLIKATDYQAVSTDGKDVLSRRELNALLDRSDLMSQRKNACANQNSDDSSTSPTVRGGFEGIFSSLEDNS